MKIAVMQPYFFPYIGYYQLVRSVDEFVFYDDVNFIKKGHINRNAILSNGRRLDFSIPVSRMSQNRKISAHSYLGDFRKFLKQVSASYRNAPYFRNVCRLVEQVVLDREMSISIKNSRSIRTVFDYLGLPARFSFSSELRIPPEFRSQDRIIEICKRKGASQYHNPIGGAALYEKEVFRRNDIELVFLQPVESRYRQQAPDFVPRLSMIDVLMWNDMAHVQRMLNGFQLI